METREFEIGKNMPTITYENVHILEDLYRKRTRLSDTIWLGFPDGKGPMTEEHLKKNLQRELDLAWSQLKIAKGLAVMKPCQFNELLLGYQSDQFALLTEAQDLQTLGGKIAAKEFLREKQKYIGARLAVFIVYLQNPTLINQLESQFNAVGAAFNLISPEPVPATVSA